ncbi:MAG: glycosyltransferase [Gammaproteobacteria bacterium]|nr:glycosyltransferase [Gammaproteobacteria bacterium]
MNASLDIIIVNWNAGQQLRDCLESIILAQNSGVSLGRVVVVDNGSSDSSLKGLDSLSLPLDIVLNSVNRGFGAACNQGAALCNSRYLLFLNPDTKLFDNSLDIPMAFMENEVNKGVGICGIQLVDEKGQVARTCAYFPSLSRFFTQAVGLNKLQGLRGSGVHMDEWNHYSDKLVDHVIGAFFFMRRTMFESLSGFDERFFVYLEDVDFSLRAKQSGWETSYLTEAQAFHLGGGTSSQVKAHRLFYSLRSRLLYGFKHFSPFQAWVFLGVTLFLEPLNRLVFSLLRGGTQDVSNTWRGYRMLYRDLPNIFDKSKIS